MINSNLNFIDSHYPEKQTLLNQNQPLKVKFHYLNDLKIIF